MTRFDSTLQSPGLIAASVVAAGLIVGFSVSGAHLRYDLVWAPAVCGAIFVGILAAKPLVGTSVGRFLAFAGRRSIVFYTLHWAVLLVSFHALFRVGVTNSAVLSIMVPIIAVACGLLTCFLTNRYRALNTLFALPVRL